MLYCYLFNLLLTYFCTSYLIWLEAITFNGFFFSNRSFVPVSSERHKSNRLNMSLNTFHSLTSVLPSSVHQRASSFSVRVMLLCILEPLYLLVERLLGFEIVNLNNSFLAPMLYFLPLKRPFALRLKVQTIRSMHHRAVDRSVAESSSNSLTASMHHRFAMSYPLRGNIRRLL